MEAIRKTMCIEKEKKWQRQDLKKVWVKCLMSRRVFIFR